MAEQLTPNRNLVRHTSDTDTLNRTMWNQVVDVLDLAPTAADVSSKAAANVTVNLTGNQTVAGTKTFSSSPIVPTPTTDMQTSTKKYVDDTAVAKAAGVGVVFHGTNASTARPSGYAMIIWNGSVEPTNANAATDLWLE